MGILNTTSSQNGENSSESSEFTTNLKAGVHVSSKSTTSGRNSRVFCRNLLQDVLKV